LVVFHFYWQPIINEIELLRPSWLVGGLVRCECRVFF